MKDRYDEIKPKLLKLENERDIKILFAVESGSRAWGFQSPDSDYDIRFVYANNTDFYVSLFQYPDYIEYTEGDFDFSGWDSRKALKLMMNGNHSIREWLMSQIVYMDRNYISRFADLAKRTPSYVKLVYSYRSLLHKVIKDYLGFDKEQVNLKKYFYGIRSALAIKWLTLNQYPFAIPPMNLVSLVKETRISNELIYEIGELQRLKANTKEIGLGNRIPIIDNLMKEYVDYVSPLNQFDIELNMREEYNKLFRETVYKL